MAREIAFYFDFLSPFCYLANVRLPDIAANYGYTVAYKPFDMPKAKREAGNTGPANREIPVKLRYLKADLQRWADRYGVPLTFPPNFNSSALNIAAFYAIEADKARPYVDLAYDKVWGAGRAPDDPAVLREISEVLDMDAEAMAAFAASPEGTAQLAAVNNEARERGIFGAPIMTIGDEMWWGNDRLAFLEEWLKAEAGGGTARATA